MKRENASSKTHTVAASKLQSFPLPIRLDSLFTSESLLFYRKIKNILHNSRLAMIFFVFLFSFFVVKCGKKLGKNSVLLRVLYRYNGWRSTFSRQTAQKNEFFSSNENETRTSSWWRHELNKLSTLHCSLLRDLDYFHDLDVAEGVWACVCVTFHLQCVHRHFS